MADFPLFAGDGADPLGMNAAASIMTTVTAGARVYGTYAELIASTARSYEGLSLFVHTPSVAGAMVNIAINVAGTDYVIATDIPVHQPLTRQLILQHFLPLHLPAGASVRVAMTRDAGTSGTFQVGMLGHRPSPRGWRAFQRATGYGIPSNFATSPTATPDATANTKGAFAEIVASTTYPMRAMLLCLRTGATATQSFLVDFARGAAASEVVTVGDVPMRAHTNVQETAAQSTLVGTDIPAGTRLSFRAQSSIASGGGLAGHVIGFD